MMIELTQDEIGFLIEVLGWGKYFYEKESHKYVEPYLKSVSREKVHQQYIEAHYKRVNERLGKYNSIISKISAIRK